MHFEIKGAGIQYYSYKHHILLRRSWFNKFISTHCYICLYVFV